MYQVKAKTARSSPLVTESNNTALDKCNLSVLTTVLIIYCIIGFIQTVKLAIYIRALDCGNVCRKPEPKLLGERVNAAVFPCM